MGLPGMVPGDASRVASANAIYERIALFCLSHDVAWTIGKPTKQLALGPPVNA